MSHTHCLGFPRIGLNRETKKAVEAYWRGDIDQEALLEEGRRLRQRHWQLQKDVGLDFVSVGDFSWYDHVLDMSVLLGVIPSRFGALSESASTNLDTLFRMARGRAPSGEDQAACEMTKWFDTNYHYIVPELVEEQTFSLSSNTLFEHIQEAQALGHRVKPVLLGPLSFLWLAKSKTTGHDKLDCLAKLLSAYADIFSKLKSLNVEWVQMDEPILALDLPTNWRTAFEQAYNQMQFADIKVLLTTYFGALQDNASLAAELPVAGLHIDCVRGDDQIATIVDKLPAYKILSLGVIDGRNIWRADLNKILDKLEPIYERLGARLWIGSSCSLLHTPVDLSKEILLDPNIKQWLSFSVQKLGEISIIGQALKNGRDCVSEALKDSQTACDARRKSTIVHNASVQARMKAMTDAETKRQHDFSQRFTAQQNVLKLPQFPTTTIGSFPQTSDIRAIRKQYKTQAISEAEYNEKMKNLIDEVIEKQESLDLDVLVHGEPERNDMVEYFGEMLDGFAFTENGWVQSYGSRCVKPPIIYGDVSRPKAMTVEWMQYAQNQTKKWMKGMLTGPVTILCWSFVRDDQPRESTCLQIALALRDEVNDLEKVGIRIIQIDEPAFREGLPLRQKEWKAYLHWAVKAFRLSSSGVDDATQIHTHMCYAEFNDIIESIADLDADVITMEASRSQKELFESFHDFQYPNQIGPGVYDIHSPIVPSVKDMMDMLQTAKNYIPAERLWVNPDCGLKTRGWPEVESALQNMVQAAKQMRSQ